MSRRQPLSSVPVNVVAHGVISRDEIKSEKMSKVKLKYRDTNINEAGIKDRVKERDASLNNEQKTKNKELAVIRETKIQKLDRKCHKDVRFIIKEDQKSEAAKSLTREISTQTDITVTLIAPRVEVQDLIAVKASAAYWRALADRFEADLDSELKRNFELSVQLGKEKDALAEVEKDIEVLTDYIEDTVGEVDEHGCS
ncbi:hypothetical protein AB6A40_009150 [Gnathostoma spinigerum]|uniref:Uncharacterized protein n=1 Tax=Gnathostoma spinigerum TaxID=75299 RepID=A0ABD6ESZ3_9BILA